MTVSEKVGFNRRGAESAEETGFFLSVSASPRWMLISYDFIFNSFLNPALESLHSATAHTGRQKHERDRALADLLACSGINCDDRHVEFAERHSRGNGEKCLR